MPDDVDGSLSLIHSRAIELLDNFLTAHPVPGRPLSDDELQPYRARNAVSGWRIELEFSGSVRQIDFLVNTCFPYSPPEIFLVGKPASLEWPNIEENGKLCIAPDNTAISSKNPVGVANVFLLDAIELIHENTTTNPDDRFRDEFLSYWKIHATSNIRRHFSLAEPNPKSRRITIYHGDPFSVIADGDDALTTWLTNYGIPKPDQGFSFLHGILVWLPRPLIPAEFPKTGLDILRIAHRLSVGGRAALTSIDISNLRYVTVILGSSTPRGACFAGIQVKNPYSSSDIARKWLSNLKKKFREQIPRALILKQFFSENAAIECFNVDRADHSWVHGRDQDQRQQHLANSKLSVLGCGSVGGQVVRLLAGAGVGSLFLYDDDLFSWANISRHFLGAQAVSKHKVSELGGEIKKNFPHLRNIIPISRKFNFGNRDLLPEIRKSDLVLSATGNWACDSFLNDCQLQYSGFPPVVYSWVEPFSSAAHAVAIFQGHGCLFCGFLDGGLPRERVTEWQENKGKKQEPACGNFYSPYGMVELSFANTMISDLVLDVLTGKVTNSIRRVWVGRKSIISENNGRWDRSWVSKHGDPKDGGFITELDWPKESDCTTCSIRV